MHNLKYKFIIAIILLIVENKQSYSKEITQTDLEVRKNILIASMSLKDLEDKLQILDELPGLRQACKESIQDKRSISVCYHLINIEKKLELTTIQKQNKRLNLLDIHCKEFASKWLDYENKIEQQYMSKNCLSYIDKAIKLRKYINSD